MNCSRSSARRLPRAPEGVVANLKDFYEGSTTARQIGTNGAQRQALVFACLPPPPPDRGARDKIDTLDIEANPYATPEAARAIEALLPDRRERGIWVQSARNLLADDDALLAASAVHATVEVFAQLIKHLAAQNRLVGVDDQQLLAAEGIVHLALASRAAGEPKLPARQ